MRHQLLLPFLLAATLAACDRGGSEPEKDPSTFTRNGTPAAATPREGADPAPGTAAAQPRQTLAPATPQRDTLSDTVITGKIKAAILTDPGMTGADVSINTDKGVVVLSGTVKSQEQTAIASAHAQRQDGVMRVDSHLALAPQ